MKRTEFFSKLLAGDQHRDGIRCLRLFRVADLNFQTLRQEVNRFRELHRPSQVSAAGHITHWANPVGQVEQYSLLNHSGRSDDFSTDHDLSCKGKWFFDQDTYPALGNLIADWPHLINFRLNVLRPGAALPAHEEHVPFRTKAGTAGARLRFHLPVQTNDEAELHLDGLVYRLKTGVIYLVNQGCVHAAQNHGPRTRVHLVWDSLLTEELYAFLFQNRCVPPGLSAIIEREEIPLRTEAPRPYRRLPPPLSVTEAAALALCHPQ